MNNKLTDNPNTNLHDTLDNNSLKKRSVSTLAGIIIIITIALIAIGGVFAYEYFATQQTPVVEQNVVQSNQNQIADWKTYVNTQSGYSIKYPSDWTFREYPAQTGGGFRPINKPDGVEYEFINIDNSGRGSDYCAIPFSEYVKKAATLEIQNYESLNSIEKVDNLDGTEAYKATWNYTDLRGNKKVSLPFTYFGSGKQDCGSLQLRLNDNTYLDIYNKMIGTFKFANTSGILPTIVGQCSQTKVERVETRIMDCGGGAYSTNCKPIVGSGSAIVYTNGGHQVSYSEVQGIENSRPGDRINLCLISLPTNCPPGDKRGKFYGATNLRTGEKWELSDSEHMCGGA